MRTSSRHPAISARYVLWVQVLLVWAATLLVPLRPSARHLRQRGWFACTHRLAGLVRNLIVLRAAELARVDRRPPIARNDARPGFRRRMRVRHLLRAATGAQLRRALRHRCDGKRLSILLDALADLETHAATLARRARRGLTRLRPVMLVRPSPCALGGVLSAAPAPADTS